MRVDKIKKYKTVEDNQTAGWTDSPREADYWIWVNGPTIYYNKLKAAFPDIAFERVSTASKAGYSWCVSISEIDTNKWEEIKYFLPVLRRTLCIETPLDDCFALGWHSKPGKPGKPALTALGQWISMAKSYCNDPSSPGSLPVAGLIADQMQEFIKRHPVYRHSDMLVAALPSNPDKAFDLPCVLAQTLEGDTGIPFIRQALIKTRMTAQMKYCLTLEEKVDNIRGSISSRASCVAGKTVLIIDDVFGSGVTLWETAKSLREAGAAKILGLTATKTLKRRFL
jgi:predicted amidophosphoribosyltransferase